MTKEQFHKKFLNLTLLARNEEYFPPENHIGLYRNITIYYVLWWAFDEKEDIYTRNSHFAFPCYNSELPVSLWYLFFRDQEIDWKI